MSLFFPSLSIIISIIFLIIIVPDFGLGEAAFIAALGLVCGGLMPLFLIIFLKVDTSKFFAGKMIIFTTLVIGIILSWFVFDVWTVQKSNVFTLSFFILTAEIIFALTRKTNPKTKLCLILSSSVYMYTGFIIDFARSLAKVTL